MSVARAGFLPDSWKYCILTIDSFHNRLLKGQVFHQSLDRGRVFEGILDMACALEELFDRQGYPMKSEDCRCFGKGLRKAGDGDATGRMTGGEWKDRQDGLEAYNGRGEAGGRFLLCVKYRYYTTWQGEIKNLENGKAYAFLSFLQLMEYFNRELGEGRIEIVGRSFSFTNEFGLLAAMKHWMEPMGGDFGDGRDWEKEGVAGAEVKREGTGTFLVSCNRPASVAFVVRVLFQRNSTWQGTVLWKKNGRKMNFRSFYEMLLLMAEVKCSGGRKNAWDRIWSGGLIRVLSLEAVKAR